MTTTIIKMSPYTMGDPPTSSGRVLLATGFEHYCVLEWGLSGEEIEAALEDRPGSDPHIRTQVRGAARLIGRILADGGVRCFARPFGGGVSREIAAERWELDDFDLRFRTSAIALDRPFDDAAPPTHWIFLDGEDFDELIERAFGPRPAVRAPVASAPPPGGLASTPVAVTADRFLRRPEVQRRTGLSKSTLYARIEAGRFPASVNLGGNVAGWRESEVSAWIAKPC